MFLWLQTVFRERQKSRLTRHLSDNIARRILGLAAILLLLVALHSAAMVLFEDMGVGNAIWLSFTTVTTVGYGDYSASTLPGRIATVVTLYGFAITTLSLLAAEVIEWRLGKSEQKRKGLWEWRDMSNHIQIINTPNADTERYLCRLVKEIQLTPTLSDLPIQILTRKFPDGLPNSLVELKVLHRTGIAEDGEIIRHINLEKAKHIVILARDSSDSVSDSVSFDILSRAVQINSRANIVVEAVLDDNRSRFLQLGASAVLRPVRAYPEMVARTLAHPGTERVLEELFDVEEDSLHRLACSFERVRWKDIIYKCIEHDLGTPVAYFQNDTLHTQPGFEEECSGEALAVVVNERNNTDPSRLQRDLAKIARNPV
jgi:voltage-gated potassium channel